jgi:hypothetical protein
LLYLDGEAVTDRNVFLLFTGEDDNGNLDALLANEEKRA